MNDNKLMAAVMAAVNAYLEQDTAQARPQTKRGWAYNGRVLATTQGYTWLRRPRSR